MAGFACGLPEMETLARKNISLYNRDCKRTDGGPAPVELEALLRADDVPRDRKWQDLREAYERWKTLARKNIALYNRDCKRTGGGPAPIKKPSDTDYLLMEISAEDFEIDESTCDSDSVASHPRNDLSYDLSYDKQNRSDLTINRSMYVEEIVLSPGLRKPSESNEKSIPTDCADQQIVACMPT
ncbi:hypothetical protein FQR65_LT11467 [Abscondita terminalis]|nr:hypothetical protein FQR65_LT11467 [Abscondita terminalis]